MYNLLDLEHASDPVAQKWGGLMSGGVGACVPPGAEPAERPKLGPASGSRLPRGMVPFREAGAVGRGVVGLPCQIVTVGARAPLAERR